MKQLAHAPDFQKSQKWWLIDKTCHQVRSTCHLARFVRWSTTKETDIKTMCKRSLTRFMAIPPGSVNSWYKQVTRTWSTDQLSRHDKFSRDTALNTCFDDAAKISGPQRCTWTLNERHDVESTLVQFYILRVHLRKDRPNWQSGLWPLSWKRNYIRTPDFLVEKKKLSEVCLSNQPVQQI